MKRVFLDANILLEVLFSRNLSAKCEALMRNPANGYSISALTVHIVWYMAERYKVQTELVDSMLSVFEMLPLSEKTVEAARVRYDGKDFEDCLQAACAEAGNCNEVITIDSSFKDNSYTPLNVVVVR